MYTLCRGLWNEHFTRLEYRLLLVGCEAAGKSLLLEQIRHLLTLGAAPLTYACRPYQPTVGLNIARIGQLPAPNSHLSLLCWDLGGMKQLRPLWANYCEEAHAILFVVDSSDKLKFKESVDELLLLMRDEKLACAPFLVLLNKSDLQSAAEQQQSQHSIQLQIAQQFSAQQQKINQTNELNQIIQSNGLNANSTRDESANTNSSNEPLNGSSTDEPNSHIVQLDQPQFRVDSISALTGDGLQSALDWILATLRDSDRTKLLADREIT